METSRCQSRICCKSMNKTTKKIFINIAQIAGLIAAALLVWYAACIVTRNEFVVPDPWNTVRLAFTMLGEGKIWLSLLATLARSAVAFALSLSVALGLALFSGTFPKTRFAVGVMVTFLRALPTIAIILMMLVVFRSTTVPVVVAFLVAFPVAYSAFERQFDRNKQLFDVCKVYDVTAANRIRYYLFPLIKEEIFSVVQEELPLCIKVVIAGEVLALPLNAVGREMYASKIALETARVVALTVLVLAVCYVIGGILTLIGRRCCDRIK